MRRDCDDDDDDGDDDACVFECDFIDFEWSGECAERRNTGCKAMCRNVTV